MSAAMRCAFTAAVALLPAAVVCTAAELECPDGSGMAEAESEQMQTELVQTRAQIKTAGEGEQPPRAIVASASGLLHSKAGAQLSVEQRASLLVPVAWFHVSKTGTSICNTLYHTPAICPSFSDDNYVEDSLDGGSWSDSWGEKEDICTGLSESYMILSTERGNLDGPDPHSPIQPYSHVGIGGLQGRLYLMNRGHFVTMLRQPEQRLISMYNHYGPLPLLSLDRENGLQVREWPYKTPHPRLREYAELNAGCTVRQLTMDVLVPSDTLPLPTSEDVSHAIAVLQEGFAFVGITEQWALSVCLFRLMFGGNFLKSDLLDTRPGTFYNSSDDGYDTSELEGWVDDLDGPLYADALSMFESTRKVYGADPSSCSALFEGSTS